MNNSKTAILIDSGCDLSNEIIDKYDIKIICLKVMYGETVYSDGLDIDPMTVYEKFPNEIPKTSTPNMQEVFDKVEEVRAEGYEKVIAITISSGLSGTYNTVAMALNQVKNMETYAFDSKNISTGSGMFAIWAAMELEAGKSFEQVVKGLNSKINDSHIYFYMDTLEYLRKGGRINPAVSIIGKALNLKPIISCDKSGVYYTVSKIHGSKRGLRKLLEIAVEEGNKGKAWLAVLNGYAKDVVEQVKPQLMEKIPNGEIIIDKQITASMAIHTGPGLIGICVFLL